MKRWNHSRCARELVLSCVPAGLGLCAGNGVLAVGQCSRCHHTPGLEGEEAELSLGAGWSKGALREQFLPSHGAIDAKLERGRF